MRPLHLSSLSLPFLPHCRGMLLLRRQITPLPFLARCWIHQIDCQLVGDRWMGSDTMGLPISLHGVQEVLRLHDLECLGQIVLG